MFEYNYGFMPQQMRQPMMTGINGRTVNRVEDITVNDVPTNGELGFFPTADNSKIYAKRWNANGMIQTITYLPQIDTNAQEVNNLSLEDKKPLYEEITQRLKGIEDNIIKLMEGIHEHPTDNRSNDAGN